MNFPIPHPLLSTILLLTIALNSVTAEDVDTDFKGFKFGVIADCQYCDVEGKGARKYRLSPEKLEAAVEHFNTLDLKFITHLGDFIDRDFKSFDVVGPIWNELKASKYHVLGNHDFEVADERKKDVPAKMGLTSRYYDFQVNGWRFVALDGNDISFHAHPPGSEEYKAAEEYYKTKELSSPKWNGAVGPEQMTWLENVLKRANDADEKVILFCHFPIFPENNHNLWNAKEIIALIERYPCVKAYMNGHNHAGNYAMKNDVHYLTFKGMVDTEESSYATVEIGPEQLEITGYGRETPRALSIDN